MGVQTSIERGQWAESLAEQFLRRQGLKSLQRNYRCKSGEIDLVMLERETLVFVEVRYRQGSDYGSGADSVTAKKRQRLVATAQRYVQQRGLPEPPCRFDVVSVSSLHGRPQIDWIPNAFDA